IVEAPSVAEKVVAENAVAAGRDAVDAVEHFGLAVLRVHDGLRVGREDAVLDDERAAIKGDVFNRWSGRPGAMVDEDDGVIDVELGVVAADGGAAARIEVDVGQAALGRGVEEVETAPVAAAGDAGEADVLGLAAFGQ